jgi:hypothetical protein
MQNSEKPGRTLKIYKNLRLERLTVKNIKQYTGAERPIVERSTKIQLCTVRNVLSYG